MNIILQINDNLSAERKCIKKLSMIRDDIEIYEIYYEDLDRYVDLLKTGALPVGSVEFTEYAMELANIKIPEFDCYDDSIKGLLGRKIYNERLFNIEHIINHHKELFIKPRQCKLFNGFIFRGYDYETYSEHDLEQLKKLKIIDALKEPLYCSEVINIIAEWRCYINKGKLITICQYDDSEEDLEPDKSFVDTCLNRIGNKTLALDIGMLDNGYFVVIELNDAWAIGKYQGISDKDYLDFITTRWSEICSI
jgi:hypothetical protein